MAYKRFLVCADNHGHLVDADAMIKLMAFADSWKPHYRIHLGDLWDFSPLRKGASPEDRAEGIAMDYLAGMTFLDAFKPNYLTIGNHDDRIWLGMNSGDGILQERCAELVKHSEEQFKKRKITWCSYHVSKYLQMPEGGPKLLHGFRATMYPARSHYENWGSCLVGHVHKPDIYSARHIDGSQAFSLGCMANIDALTYADRHAAKLSWRNGFLYGLINDKTGAWNAWNVTREGDDWISPQGIL
jgi:predicted phosphodiesterase